MHENKFLAVECPSYIINSIGGWTIAGVDQRHGFGQPVEVNAAWMNLIFG